jgi:hypothetical protein
MDPAKRCLGFILYYSHKKHPFILFTYLFEICTCKKLKENRGVHYRMMEKSEDNKIDLNDTGNDSVIMRKTREELIVLCKEMKVKGYSGKKREEIVALLNAHQDTGKFRSNMKDQFYTNERVAASCIETIIGLFPVTKDYLWIEPSAGNGAFLHRLPMEFDKIGIDIDPKSPDILKQDYLEWDPPKVEKDCIIFGNPPFGRQSSLAKSFIEKSCSFAKIVAFILPKSFVKPSMFNAFDKKFHMIHSADLENDAFVINGGSYDVPCVFQIWEKKEVDRPAVEKVGPVRFRYVKPTETYDIAFRRVGALAGRCYPQGAPFSPQSHYFLKLDSVAHIEAIIEKINQHTFPSNTVGPRSLSQTEANVVINRILSSY